MRCSTARGPYGRNSGLPVICRHQNELQIVNGDLPGIIGGASLRGKRFRGRYGRAINRRQQSCVDRRDRRVCIRGDQPILFPGSKFTATSLIWSIVIGVGAAGGPLMLYRGLAIGQMSVVSPLSAIVSAVAPALVGVALGERFSISADVGLIMAVRAIGLVSWQRPPKGDETIGPHTKQRSGLLEGILSGGGFALLFVGLDQADLSAGTWPLVIGLALAILLIIPFAWHDRIRARPQRAILLLVIVAGVLGGAANLFFLVATRYGQLSIIAVLTALYPSVTVLLARFILSERWNAVQLVGLLNAAIAVSLIAAG